MSRKTTFQFTCAVTVTIVLIFFPHKVSCKWFSHLNYGLGINIVNMFIAVCIAFVMLWSLLFSAPSFPAPPTPPPTPSPSNPSPPPPSPS